MEAPSDSEISARLQRATRSALAESSYINRFKQRQGQQYPSLSDVLSQLGSPKDLHCPKCRAFLPFGARSQLCLACANPLQSLPRLAFTSSAACRHLLEALQISEDGVETNLQELEDDQEFDTLNNQTSPSSFSQAEVGNKVLSQSGLHTQPSETAVVAPVPVASTAELPVVSPATTSVMPASVHENKSASLDDYSVKLKGISLEDFFTSQTNSVNTGTAKPNVVTHNLSEDFFTSQTKPVSTVTSKPNVGTSNLLDRESTGVSVRKDSFFWDPLSDSIIPDGHDLMQGTSAEETFLRTDKNEVEEDDSFSWDAEFQSAAPTATVSSSSWFETQVPPQAAVGSSDSWFQLQEPNQSSSTANSEDLFGNFSTATEMNTVQNLANQESHSSQENVDFFALQSTTSSVSGDLFTSQGQNNGFDGLIFESSFQEGKQVSMPFANFPNDVNSSNDLNEIDLFGPTPADRGGVIATSSAESSSYDAFGDVSKTMPAASYDLDKEQSSQSIGETNKTIQLLFDQMHDLSFMLSDELVTKRKD